MRGTYLWPNATYANRAMSLRRLRSDIVHLLRMVLDSSQNKVGCVDLTDNVDEYWEQGQ